MSIAHNPGTEGSRGVIPAEREWMPSPDCKLVRFGADFIFTSRRYSEKFLRQAAARLVRHGVPEFASVQIKAWGADDARFDGLSFDLQDRARQELSRLVIA